MLVDQHFPRTHLCVHDVCALQMPKRTQQSESQLAAAKRARDATAEARRLRNAATDAAPVANPPPASTTGSSSSTVAPSAVAPADDLLRMAAPAAATQAAPDGATETGGSHATVRFTSPTRREATRTRRSSLPPDVCTDAHGTHAQLAPDCAGGAGCFGGFCRTDRALHVIRAAACLAGPAAVCLPLPPPAACARARSIAASTRPLFAARRCRSGCECRRC